MVWRSEYFLKKRLSIFRLEGGAAHLTETGGAAAAAPAPAAAAPAGPGPTYKNSSSAPSSAGAYPRAAAPAAAAADVGGNALLAAFAEERRRLEALRAEVSESLASFKARRRAGEPRALPPLSCFPYFLLSLESCASPPLGPWALPG